MVDSFFRRVLSPVVTFREGEATTGVLMFVYSFLVMTAYNNIKPSAASKFIDDLGADNVPYAFLVAGLTMGFILNYYSRGVGKIPKLWVLPGTQLLLIAALVSFWFLFQTGQPWVSAAFFFFGRLLLGIFLISQFWTLANDIYDPRQAKRVFGFIGGGATLGGMTGSAITWRLVERVGTENLILLSAGILGLCFFLILAIQRRTKTANTQTFEAKSSLGGGEALAMLRKSKHLQIIALIIGFGALGAATLEQQLYMASAAEVVGKDAVTSFLASITFYISVIGFVIQVYFTSRIYSLLGIGFALAILPVSLGATALIIILNKALWASGLARVSDSALRYSIDKTTRETLFLPLPADLKLKAKSFVDVVADRFIGKGIGSAILLVAIKIFGASWWQLSFLSLGYCIFWFVLTRRAKREYRAVFRRSIETLSLEPERLTPRVGDLATVETLVEELGSPDDGRVIRSIELLEALEKNNLVTPLLLQHESSRVRYRALQTIQKTRPELITRWLPAVERSLKDEDPSVRAAAVEVLASAVNGNVRDLMKPYLDDSDPRIVATAAVALADNGDEADRSAARHTLEKLASDTRDTGVAARREVARATARTTDPSFRQLLIPLLNDPDRSVRREAIQSARLLGDTDYVFVPALVSLLRDRQLKNTAREVLVSYGEGVIPALVFFLNDEHEDPWVRRRIPRTLALIPCEASVAELLKCLGGDDGFIRYKALRALERVRREHPEIEVAREPIEELLSKEIRRYYRYLGVSYDLFENGGTASLSRDTLLARALGEKTARGMDRIYRLLGLLHDWSEIRASRWAIEHGDGRAQTNAVEFLDNTLSGSLRKMFLPLVDEISDEERVRKGNVLLKTRARGVEEVLARLIYDEDPVIAATAIEVVREQRMWSLADDLEQVLAFRDAKDFAVFESASYALADYRAQSEGTRAV